MIKRIKIKNQWVGEGYPTFVIAEAGLNHNGKLELAKKLVIEAAKTGADTVKFQFFKADKIVTKRNAFARDFFRNLEFSPTQWKELARLAEKTGILFSASVFDEESADFLQKLNAPYYKIASGDLTHIPLISHVARKGKAMIISTGAGEMKDMKEARDAVLKTGNKNLALLHCISNYPTQPQDAHLEMIQVIKKAFGVPSGFSDHTIGIGIPVGAVALGARVIEKHFTLDNKLPGPDHQLSLDPRDFATMVDAIRKVEVSVGKGFGKQGRPDIRERFGARRTIIAAKNIARGTKIAKQMLKVVRAGNKGLAPKYFNSLVGKVAKRNIEAEEPITRNFI